MKASELKQGETYGTVWGVEMEFIGTENLSAYYEELDETLSDTRYVFVDAGGKSYMSEEEVERFVSNGTVEISTKRLNEIMNGCVERDKQIDKAFNLVNKVIGKIEDMKWDCDGEVYDALLKIQDVLGR